MTERDAKTRGASHLALMDRVYRRQRHIYNLTRKYYLLGRDRLVRNLNAQPGQSIAEIGCGTARNLIQVAAMYRGVMLYGLDASSEMLRTAEDAVARAGLTGRISLKHALAEEVTPALFGADAPFDHVIFSYSLSMIPDWRTALLAAASATRHDGYVHIVDFGDLASLWPWAANALRRWLRLFHVTPREELLKTLEAVSHRRSDCTLQLLPGRYAFVFKASPAIVTEISQTRSNP